MRTRAHTGSGRALITGASSGLGAEFARQLAAEGLSLVLVARRRDRLTALARDLRERHDVDIEVIVADLASCADVDRVARRLRSQERPVTFLVNNAGFGLGQAFHSGDLKREEAALAVMVRAVMVLSHAAAQTMAQRGRGAICNVSSIVADTAMGTYAAHKTWVNQFTQVLAEDLRGTGVHVVSLRPGTLATEFWTAEGGEGTAPTIAVLPLERVVRAALSALRRGRVVCVPGLTYALIDLVDAKAPRGLIRRLSAAIYRARARS
ncbi:SDR family oxidoreductase [Nanchangia anserum]|uniref:SDR family oxidoreductase n=1 Tax=Nanchangia anserum TaxID=2692125 RepID=A0A8I0G7S6_9ACTO|nr:SDR family oxidoreductase [Nanchangia anserum]MBD3689417.1 SDR family oxidoreductase [Nanchangia anserum]QOX81623.1 SDR family oxidoreductase [Nanchangia anserum]